MKKLLLATNNPGKIQEISMFLSDIPLEIITLSQAGITEQAPENGRTFLENASSKALFYMKQTGLPALADDGGIEIDVLNGEPGVDSHRWISKTKDDSDDDLIAYTIDRMKDVPKDKRGAQMHVLLTLALPDGQLFTTEGIVRGIITLEPSKNRISGYPFRSLFYLPEINKYYDHLELTSQETEQYNHRKQAINRMKPILMKEVVGQTASV